MDKGSRVKVVKGRTVPVGITGTVFWTGDNKFGEGKRLGVEGDDGETYWIAAANVEATDAEPPEVEAPEKGATVRFTLDEAPREGTVFWSGPSKNGRGMRIGVKDGEGETHWFDARQVEVVGDPSQSWSEEVPPF